MLSTTIKEATREAHLDLEKVVVQKLKAIRNAGDYAELLQYFYNYFSQLEKAIAPYITGDILPDYLERRNATYLKNDIETLGYSTEGLPVVSLPDIQNIAQAFGALYVMEGSIMGGGIIVKMLEKVGVNNGVSFFSGYGAETGKMWNAFTEAMNTTLKNEIEKKEAIFTANETFKHFAEVFHTEKVA